MNDAAAESSRQHEPVAPDSARESATSTPRSTPFSSDQADARSALAELIARLVIDLEEHWNKGERRQVEMYLREHPTLEQNPEAAMELIYREYLLREEQGDQPALAEYVHRFPRHADRLRLQVELHRALKTLQAAEAGSRSGGTGGKDGPSGREASSPSIPGFDIIALVGHGGMGVVYKARQTSLDRIVALKLIREAAGIDPQSLARFQLEGKAAARLRHPHIVQVHEVGQIDGRPYACLEYIEGGNLATFLKGAPQPPRDAAQLVAQLADAVQAAHDVGVVHRDLKPANVLLERFKGKEVGIKTSSEKLAGWEPKIADFGLAKLLDVDQGLTLDRPFVGTPSYMAPEQAEGRSGQAGRAADIYALGAILYELLTGRPPFKAATVSETLEQVRSTEVVPPRQLRPALPLDLETICLKCLQKEPRARYPSAGEVGEELRRFLRGEPIRARPISAFQRGVRWCRRNPSLAVATGTASLAVLCAMGLAIGLAIQKSRAAFRLAQEATRAQSAERVALANEQKAREEEQKAKNSAEESKAVLNFLRFKVLAAAGPKGEQGGLGREATIRQAMDAAEPFIAKEFASRPTVETAIRHTMGTTYQFLGAPDLAIKQLERARELGRAHLGPDAYMTLASTNNLAIAYRDAGRLKESAALFEDTLRGRKATLGAEHSDTLTSMNNLAAIYDEIGRLPECAAMQEETLKIRKAKLGVDHPDTLQSMHNLAVTYREMDRAADAMPMDEETLRLRKIKLGADHPDTLMSMQSLANDYREVGRVAESIALHQETLKLRRANLGPDHINTFWSMSGLAESYREAGRLDEATALLEDTLRRQRTGLGSDHPDTLSSMHLLAGTYYDAGRFDRAIPLYEQCLKLRQKTLGADHPDTLWSMSNLALAYAAMGRTPEAIGLNEETLKLRKEKLGPDHADTLTSMANLASAYTSAGREREALQLFRATLLRMKTKLGLQHRTTLETVNGLARALLAVWENAAALAVLREALIAVDKQSDQSQAAADARTLLGDCLVRDGKFAEGEMSLRASLAVRERRNAGGWEAAWTKSLLGSALCGQQKYAEAEPLLVAGYQSLKESQARIPVPERGNLTQALGRLVQLYDAWGKKDKAAEWRKEQRESTAATKSAK